MKKEIIYIPLDKIKPIIELKTSVAFQKRMKRNDHFLSEYDLILPVEKDPIEDVYLLVGGYGKYLYMISAERESAPCIIEDLSDNQNEQFVKILRRLFNKGDSIKENRQMILDKLNVTIDYILKTTGFTKSEIQNNYKYNTNIPTKFINKNTSENTMNWVESLLISQEAKEFLFERAGLSKGNPKRLTHDNVKIIKKFLSEEPRFNYLTPPQQKELLYYLISFKGMVLDRLKFMVSEYTKPHKII
ncbi:hypothetical protein [Tepidibacter sp. Z1-5]|uniref:hypothetical protein n=1 Tax=Tepidibacter sp. Z1-5 TaxID=3134138 RepID=UPI0030C3527B